MFKKTFFLGMLLFVSAVMFGMSVANLTGQLNHINSQINEIKRAWKEELVRIKMAEKTSPVLYLQLKKTFDKIITSDDFIAKMNSTADQQADYIANNFIAFRNVKIDNNLSDFFPNLKIEGFGLKLYTSMANRACYLLLGQKLVQKAREVAGAITAAIQQETN